MRRTPCILALVATCGPSGDVVTAADSSSSGGTSSSETPTGTGGDGTTTETGDPGPTSGGAVVCGPPCDAPWVHEGSLEIDESTDLEALRCLVEIDGDLRIHTGEAIPPQLGNLRTVGRDVDLGLKPTMTSLAGLECLTEVGNILYLDRQPALA